MRFHPEVLIAFPPKVLGINSIPSATAPQRQSPSVPWCVGPRRQQIWQEPESARMGLKTVLRATAESAKLLTNSSRMSFYHQRRKIGQILHSMIYVKYLWKINKTNRRETIRKMRFSKPRQTPTSLEGPHSHKPDSQMSSNRMAPTARATWLIS